MYVLRGNVYIILYDIHRDDNGSMWNIKINIINLWFIVEY